MSRLHILAAICVLGLAGEVVGQGRPVELGVDVGIGLAFTETEAFSINTLTISLPTASLRAAFYASDRFWIEPQLTASYVRVDRPTFDISTAGLGLTAGLGFDLQTDASRSRLYVRPFGGLNYAYSSGEHLDSESESSTQAFLGAGVGVKIPMVERMASRLEGGMAYSFENDGNQAVFGIYVTFGFSFFTR